MKLLSLLTSAALALGLTTAPTTAQDYPNDIVRVVVGSSPGGTADTVSRLMADFLSEKFGQTFVVENLPGAGGALAANAVRTAAADGYTIQFMFSSFSILPSLNPEVGYDPVADFAPIVMVSSVPNILLAHPSFEVNSLEELITKIKADPGKYDYGSGGVGFSGHLSMEMMKQYAGLDLVHIPYAGSGKLLGALLAGEIPIAFDTLTTAVPHVESGALIPLGVTSAAASPIMPDVPPVASVVDGFEVMAWNGFVAPAGTPPEVIAMLNEGINEFLAGDRAKDFFGKVGTNIEGGSPEKFADLIAGDQKKFAEVIEAAGITVD